MFYRSRISPYHTFRALLLSGSFSMITLFTAFGQNEVSLADINLTDAYQEYAAPSAGKSVTGEEASAGGRGYTDVIGVHARSLIKIDLHKKASRFYAEVAIADSKIDYQRKDLAVVPLVDGTKLLFDTNGGQKSFAGLMGKNGTVQPGSVEFVLKGDGKELFHSGVMRSGDAPRVVDVSLKDIQILELSVLPTDDGASGDHALWIAPHIQYTEIAPAVVAADYAGKGPQLTDKTEKHLQEKIKRLPVQEISSEKTSFDWLLNPSASKAGVYATTDGKGIILANAMVSRIFRVTPNLATVDIHNSMTGESLMRAVSSEGTIRIDGKQWTLGGLMGQPERGYLKTEWIEQMTTVPHSFLVEDFEVTPIPEQIRWARSRWALNKEVITTGQRLTFTLRGERELQEVMVKIHFNIYDQIPVISKSFEVHNASGVSLNIDAFQLEYLAFADPESLGGGDPSTFRMPNIHVESDYACGGSFTEKETENTESWVTDPAYTSQRNYLLQTPCILQVAPRLGPNQTLLPDQVFRSFSVYEMPFDSDDRERKGLFKRRLHRTIAPWATENPIFMHLTSSDPQVIRTAVDQCAEVGYEMVIISFGSGLNAEDISDENIGKWKAMVDYAHSKGIEMGCYSLLASRWISDEVDVINPKTGQRGGMCFGSSPCLCSAWGYDYFDKIKTFIEKTGMRCFEHDGSYPGDACASTSHAHHKGLNDSEWNQFHKITDLYHWMCEQGIYINVPDFYFLNGSTKVGIGYREVNWSLPRDRQIIHARQLNFDCTWDRMASACWSFVPLVEYQGGGAAATLEPLSEHLYEYKTHMIQNYGAGVQACYRGPRLYDTPETKVVVKEVIDWYKKYRRILNSDIIHLRRPDARDWDGIMHVNPDEKEKAFALFFNPTDQEITRTLDVPLYYAGLTDVAEVSEQEGTPVKYNLNRDYNIRLTVRIPARGYTWYVIK